MRTLYLECSMGAAGDMLASALLEIIDDPNAFLEKLNSANIPQVEFVKEESLKCNIKGTHLKVLVNDKQENENYHDYKHSHSSLKEIENIVEGLNVSEKVKKDVLCIYEIIANAESKVHDVPVVDVHFHEVGALDAIADITSVCMILEELDVEKIITSPINTGSGTVKCAHGTLPVPAPATALILKGVPCYSNEINSELCTPTGAAILKYFCKSFSSRPVMIIEKIGYGMGKKDFETANCLRAFLGESKEKSSQITELSFNVDDMTGEEIGFLTKLLFEHGAKDVFTVPVGMKKSRTGILVSVLCDEKDKEILLSVIFKNSTTIGVREDVKNRYTLERSVKSVSTPYGNIRKKISVGYGVEKSKYEYDDLEKTAKKNSISVFEARNIAKKYDNED